MTRSILSIGLILFLSHTTSLIGQDIPEQQRPLIGKVAATWCPPCGSWGWDFFENLVMQNSEQATLITAHHSGDLTNDVAQAFSENFEAPYQPYFYYNREDQDVTSDNAADKLLEIKAKVEADWAMSPVANAGLNLLKDDESLTVESRTKFFQEATGEFYLGVYFVEDEVIAFQANQGENAVHEKILRGAISPGSFGEFLDQGTITAGTEFNHTFEASLSGLNSEHLEVITIIWNKVDDKYEVINTNLNSEFTTVSTTQDLGQLNSTLNIWPNSILSSSTITVTTNEPIFDAQLKIVDMNGRIIENIFNGHISPGQLNFSLNKESNVSSGLYILVLESNQGTLSQKFRIE